MYRKILVPVDGSPTAHAALGDAIALARLAGAPLVLLNVVDAMEHINGFECPAIYLGEVRPRFLAAARAMLDALRDEAVAQGVAAETVLVESAGARVSELIVAQAQQSGADLIVLGTHGRRGVDRLLIGSDAEQVARLAQVPVLLVRRTTGAAPPPR
ncbi:universal stress protein [Aquincola sp. MAHUQ-54]|uniref:Universal stress protein n=1 Tax=Aquincola agrisoli TaxID=3119538 RepID=A0AAW9Q9I6_9BURK